MAPLIPNQCELEAQQESCVAPYKYAFTPGDAPQIPIGEPGSIPAPGFVVSTYDARPIDTIDALHFDETYVVPNGKVLVLRSLSIAVSLQSDREPPYPLGQFLTNRFGFLNESFVDLRIDLLINDIASDNLNNVAIANAAYGEIDVPCYVLAGPSDEVRLRIRLSDATDPDWVLSVSDSYVILYGNLLTETGLGLPSEPASRRVVPVTVRDTP